MKINATQIRTGMVLELEGELCKVTEARHVTPGKGPASMQVKLKNILNDKNSDRKFRTGDKVEKAELNTVNMQYLYKEPSGYMFMNTESYDQSPISEELLGNATNYLKEGDSYPVTFFGETPVGIELPNSMQFTVTYAPPEIKKATASSSLRPIEIENGLTIQAPSFIKSGDIIKINPETNEYIERA